MAETPPSLPPAAARRSPLWMRLLLLGSLGLNLLVAGMIGGALLSGAGPGAARDAARDIGVTPFVRALPSEDRRALLRELFRERDGLRDRRRDMRESFAQLLAALRAEELDRAALERIVADQRAAGEARQRLGERLVLDRIEEMTVTERRAYADRLEADVRRPRQR
ncbi:MAG: periplasmic heavy metal sensor [Paracoccaceae bacterium]|nr:periplasmic heavy metal sensor [Paracoccaceae bacterium]